MSFERKLPPIGGEAGTLLAFVFGLWLVHEAGFEVIEFRRFALAE